MTRGEVIARIRDYLHEREIRRLSACQLEARKAGDKAKERHFDAARMQAIRERSAGQWARMDAKFMSRAKSQPRGLRR